MQNPKAAPRWANVMVMTVFIITASILLTSACVRRPPSPTGEGEVTATVPLGGDYVTPIKYRTAGGAVILEFPLRDKTCYMLEGYPDTFNCSRN